MANKPIEYATLKNGRSYPIAEINATMTILEILVTADIGALLDIYERCREGKDYQFNPTDSGNQPLIERGLMQKNGYIHDVIRAVVLSAIQGEGVDLYLGSPFAD